MPVPFKEIEVGMMLKALPIVRAPFRVPTPLGVNVTLTVQVPPEDRGDTEAQLSVSAKSPPVATLTIFRVLAAVFVTVSCCAAPLAPTFWLPKLRDTGDTVMIWGGTVTGMATWMFWPLSV